MICTTLTHAAAVADDASWSLLRPIGIQAVDETEALELRNCPRCFSTLARAIPVLSLDAARALADSVIAEVEGRAA